MERNIDKKYVAKQINGIMQMVANPSFDDGCKVFNKLYNALVALGYEYTPTIVVNKNDGTKVVSCIDGNYILIEHQSSVDSVKEIFIYNTDGKLINGLDGGFSDYLDDELIDAFNAVMGY